MSLAWLVAEFIGTFALIFMGAGSILLNEMTNGGVGLLGVAIAHGITIAVMVSSLAQVSGGKFNPAISLSLLAGGKQEILPTIYEVVAQLLGAVVGALFLTWIFPQAVVSAAQLGTPTLAEGITVGGGILTEIVTTFILVLTVYGAAVDTRGAFKAVGGFAIGCAIVVGILMAAGVSGAALNPARAFGPALVSGVWTDQYIYWVGPIVGGILAGLLYSQVIYKKYS